MSETQLATKNASAEAIETALIRGDLKLLTVPQRLEYYNQVCESLGLNPLTQPFGYHEFNNKVVLYAKKDATEQLRKLHRVSVTKLDREIVDELVVVTAYVSDGQGRTDVGTGAVNIGGVKGEAKANAIMKAETKAKRRATLSLTGLGILDESELDSVTEQISVIALETKALPEAIVAPSAVNSAPATSSDSEQLQSQLEPLPITPANAQADDLPSFSVPKAILPSAADLDAVAAETQVAASTDNSTTSPRPDAAQFAAYKSRASNLRAELEKHGFKSGPGQPAGQKLVKYFTLTAGVQKVDELTIAQWETIFSVLDASFKTDPAGTVKLIEERIKQ